MATPNVEYNIWTNGFYPEGMFHNYEQLRIAIIERLKQPHVRNLETVTIVLPNYRGTLTDLDKLALVFGAELNAFLHREGWWYLIFPHADEMRQQKIESMPQL